MNRKKVWTAVITALIILCGIIGFGAAEETPNMEFSKPLTGDGKVPVEIFIDYQNSDPMLSGIIQFPEIKYIADKPILKVIYAIFGPKSEPLEKPIILNPNACSCIYVPGDTKLGTKTLMGRNLDLDQSVCPAWMFYTNIPGKYKSFNIGYFEDALRVFGVPTMDEVRENPEIALPVIELLTYITTDAINEKGLIIEVNMRNQNDALVTTGTNPDSDIKVCDAVLLRYLIDRCATIDEVLELVKEIDIYSPNPAVLNSQFALSMMDATGRCGVMEFVGNKIVWHDSSDEDFWGEDNPGHTNFWITPEAYAVSNSCSGEARYDSLQADTKTMTSISEMWDALSKVYRKQFFTKYADEIPYDIITDCGRNFNELLEYVVNLEKEGLITLDSAKVQEVQAILDKHPEYKEKEWDREFLTNPENHDDIITCYNFITEAAQQMTQTQSNMERLKEDTFYEYAAYTYVAESGSTELKMKFFEKPEIYTFGFEENAAANQNSLSERKPKITVSLSGPSSIKLGDTNVLTAKDTDDPSAAFIWQSSNSSIAEVNQNGEVHGVNIGTVTISATNSITGETVSKKVTVEMASPLSIPETTTPDTKSTTTKSPFPVLGILAGLGVAAALVMRRKP